MAEDEKKEDKGNGDARDPVEPTPPPLRSPEGQGEELKENEPKVLIQIIERPNGSIYVNGLVNNLVMAMGWLAIGMFQVVDYHKQKMFEKNMPQKKIIKPGFGGLFDRLGRKKH